MSKQTKFKKYDLLGVEVDALTIAESVDYITQYASEKGRPTAYVVKPYVEFLDRAANDAEIKQLLNGAELCLADGVALNWAAYYLYGGGHSLRRWFYTLSQIVLQPSRLLQQLPDRILGINFTWPLLQACAKHNLTVFLIGSPKNQSIEETAKHLGQALPGLDVVGTYTGSFPPGSNDELVRELQATKPDIVLVGMGFPLQERLMALVTSKLGHGVFIGEGGTFDYQQFGGRTTKAPRFIQTINLEWLWRLLLQPSRIRRQLAIPRFMIKVYRFGRS